MLRGRQTPRKRKFKEINICRGKAEVKIVKESERVCFLRERQGRGKVSERERERVCFFERDR